MSTENKQPIDAEEREKYLNSILYEKFFSFDSWEGHLKDALTERLGYVKILFSDLPEQYTLYSLLALGSIYSINSDEENAKKHREMLFDLWLKDFQVVCGGDALDEDDVDQWKSTARMMVEKNVVCLAKCSVNIDVSCDEDSKVSYTYSSINIQNADGSTVLLPAWQLVDFDYFNRWIILHRHMDESKLTAEDADYIADMASVQYIERIDMDISDLLQDSEASEFEDSETEIEPGVIGFSTYEDFLPSDAFWMPDAGDIFGVRYYPPRMLQELWRYNWY